MLVSQTECNCITFNSCNLTEGEVLGNNYVVELNDDELLTEPLVYVTKVLLEKGTYEELLLALTGQERQYILEHIVNADITCLSPSILNHVVNKDLIEDLESITVYLEKFVNHLNVDFSNIGKNNKNPNNADTV